MRLVLAATALSNSSSYRKPVSVAAADDEVAAVGQKGLDEEHGRLRRLLFEGVAGQSGCEVVGGQNEGLLAPEKNEPPRGQLVMVADGARVKPLILRNGEG